MLAISLGLFAWNRTSSPRIAYVRSAVLVSSYTGMKEARSLYQEKMSKWKSNIDTLSKDYQQAINKYNMEVTSLSANEKKERENYLHKQEDNLRQYAGTLEQKATEEDKKMTEGVLNQINSYVKDYGEKKGYVEVPVILTTACRFKLTTSCRSKLTTLCRLKLTT